MQSSHSVRQDTLSHLPNRKKAQWDTLMFLGETSRYRQESDFLDLWRQRVKVTQLPYPTYDLAQIGCFVVILLLLQWPPFLIQMRVREASYYPKVSSPLLLKEKETYKRHPPFTISHKIPRATVALFLILPCPGWDGTEQFEAGQATARRAGTG